MDNRIITTDVTEEDFSLEGNLRPQSLDEYIGQQKTKDTLKIYIEAAKQRHDSLDHVLFYGPPGLGKTTLSAIIANEMGTHMKVTSGPAIEKPGEMAAILNNLQEGDVLFVDEIHRLNRQVEEVLYPAMEDFAIDIMIGKGASARSIRLDLPKFTLVGATTRAGLLSAPLRDRFGVTQRLEFYDKKELTTIILRSAQVLGVEIEPNGAAEIAKRSRGTPRLANRLLKRVRDFAQVKYNGVITYDVACFALDLLEVDQYGLDKTDRRILQTLILNFQGGPVGLETLAASIGEDSGTLEDVYEPYLYRQVSLTELHVEEWLPCWHIPILDILVLICRQSKSHPIIAPCLPRKPLMSCVFEFPFVKIFEHFCKSRLICSRLVGCKDRNPLNPVICIKQMAAGRRTLPSASILAGG